MLVCSKALQNVARKLQERHGTPWFEGSFYGMRDMSQSLRDFARLLNDAGLTARTEALIAVDRELSGGRFGDIIDTDFSRRGIDLGSGCEAVARGRVSAVGLPSRRRCAAWCAGPSRAGWACPSSR